MKKIKYGKILACLIASLAIVCGSFVPISAAKEDKFSISTRDWVNELGVIHPGDIIHGTFSVINVGSEGFKYTMSADPYQASDDIGTTYDVENSYTQIAKWITFDDYNGYLSSGAEEIIHYTITVPNDIPSGGQYAAIRATMTPDYSETDSSMGIVANGAVAQLIYAQGDGETRKSGEISDNNIPIFVFKPPITTSATIKNTGNIHSKATYFLQVFPLFSNEEIYTNEEDPGSATILPESQNYITQKWEDTPFVGIFKIKQTVQFADETSINEKIVFICPLWFLVSVLALICSIIVSLYVKSLKRKKAKK